MVDEKFVEGLEKYEAAPTLISRFDKIKKKIKAAKQGWEWHKEERRERINTNRKKNIDELKQRIKEAKLIEQEEKLRNKLRQNKKQDGLFGGSIMNGSSLFGNNNKKQKRMF